MAWTNRNARWFPILVVAALALSCSGAEETTGQLPPGVMEGAPSVGPAISPASPTGTVSVTPIGCANEPVIAADASRQLGTSARGDVDGDGIEDQIRLAADPEGPEGCTAFVVAEIGGSVASAPVWEVGREGGLPQPRIHGFADIDGRPGNEILVDEAAGAATQFVGAFVLVDGDLQRITADGGIVPEAGPFADLFPYGGSVGHAEAVDCTKDGIVVSTAVPAASGSMRYEVERRFFTYDDGTLDKADVVTETVPSQNLNRFPEYASGPFGSC